MFAKIRRVVWDVRDGWITYISEPYVSVNINHIVKVTETLDEVFVVTLTNGDKITTDIASVNGIFLRARSPL